MRRFPALASLTILLLLAALASCATDTGALHPVDAGRDLSQLDIRFDESADSFRRIQPDIERCLQAAFALLVSHLELSNSEPIPVFVTFLDNIRVSCSSLVFCRVQDPELNLYEQGLANALKFGVTEANSAAGVVFQLNIGVEFVENLWFDPDPVSRSTPTPQGNYLDAVSVFLHELVHAAALNGWLDSDTGLSHSPNGALSTYDRHVIRDEGHLYFAGPRSLTVNAATVPLSPNNYKHYGTREDAAGLAGSLMYGYFYQWGHRLDLSPLDLAILADCGLPVILD